MTIFLQKFRRDASGIGWLALGVFVALSLFSYVPTDPSFDSLGTSAFVRNWCGYFGSFLADALYQLWGVAAWILPLTAAVLSARCFSESRGDKKESNAVLGLLALTVAASLLGLHASGWRLFGGHIVASGAIGAVVARGLTVAFHFVGAAIALWSLTALFAIFYTDRGVREILKSPLSRLLRAWRGGGSVIKLSLYRLKTAQTGSPTEPAPAHARFCEAKPEEPTALAAVARAAPLARRNSIAYVALDRRVENWKLPELAMLETPPTVRGGVDEREVQRKSIILVDKLSQFSVNGEVRGVKPGPAVTMYEFKPNADVKISKITELADDLSLALSSESVRIIAPIPGRDVVGIETSNSTRQTVYLKDILNHDPFWSEKMRLPIALGSQADGDPRIVDLRRMPHLMVAGTTGSGKSVFVVSAITGLLFRHSPKTLRLILVDPKQVDLAAFQNVPHLLMPPIREPKKAVTALKWAIREMDKRYRSMSRFGVRDLEGFNAHVENFSKAQAEAHAQANLETAEDARKLEQYYFVSQPYIVIVVEEFGDLMAVDKANVEQVVVRLAQMARACGIHLILAMQSPRKDVVTGLIKTNIPGRISFKVASKMDSRIILDDSGAERLLATGDMLYLAPGVSKPQRHHGPWVTEAEIAAIMRFWSDQGAPQFDPLAMKALEGSGGGFDFGGSDEGENGSTDATGDDAQEYDERYDEILAYTSSLKEVSASLLQRRFKLGYPRAARMIELFEREGVVGPASGSKPRQVLVASHGP